MTSEFYSKFGMDLRKGKNIEVFESGSKFFHASGIEVVSYYVAEPQRSIYLTKDTNKYINHVCDCCKSDLVKIEPGIFADSEEEEDIKIRPKRHLVWEDKDGNIYKTCYKKKVCIDKANERMERYREKVLSGNKIDLKSFWGDSHSAELSRDYQLYGALYNESYDSLYSHRYARLESTFNTFVRPFILKWSRCDIDKSNVMSFLDDFHSLKPHSDLYSDNLIRSVFLDKIIILIGATK